MALGGDFLGAKGAAFFQMRQAGLALLVALGVIRAVGLQEAGEGNGAAGGGEFHVIAAIIRGGRAGHGDLHGGSLGIGHLGGDGALPNQVIELKLLRIQLAGKLAWGGEGLAGRADGLVSFLRVFDLAVIHARGIGNVFCAVDAGGGVARGGQTLLGQRGRVRTHISNVAVFVQALRNAHGALGGKVQAAAGLLLQRGGHKRRIGLARIGLVFHPGDFHARALERRLQGLGLRLGNDNDVFALDVSAIIKVAAQGHALAIDGREAGVESSEVIRIRSAGIQGGGQIPVVGRDERHALALALDDDAGGHRLHAAGRKPRHDLLPQHRGNLVAVEAVEDAAGFLGVDKVVIQIAGIVRGLQDGGLGDLIEHHAAHRHLGL